MLVIPVERRDLATQRNNRTYHGTRSHLLHRARSRKNISSLLPHIAINYICDSTRGAILFSLISIPALPTSFPSLSIRKTKCPLSSSRRMLRTRLTSYCVTPSLTWQGILLLSILVRSYTTVPTISIPRLILVYNVLAGSCILTITLDCFGSIIQATGV
jgi:hypothetical protein